MWGVVVCRGCCHPCVGCGHPWAVHCHLWVGHGRPLMGSRRLWIRVCCHP